jgi:hypothetical protein
MPLENGCAVHERVCYAALEAACVSSARRSAGVYDDQADVARQHGPTLQLGDPSTQMNESSFRRGQHIDMVDRVELAPDGRPAAFVLRDPFDIERRLTDLARVWFFVGRAGAIFL